MASHCGRLYHLGARPVARSTLADASAKRPAAVLAGLLGALMAQAQRGLRRKLEEAVRLIGRAGLRLVTSATMIAPGGQSWMPKAAEPAPDPDPG